MVVALSLAANSNDCIPAAPNTVHCHVEVTSYPMSRCHVEVTSFPLSRNFLFIVTCPSPLSRGSNFLRGFAIVSSLQSVEMFIGYSLHPHADGTAQSCLLTFLLAVCRLLCF